ncbi:hypothetical protein GCM10011534_43190 [Pseudooceanicola nanhaiensis]|uniref:TRAP transporter small permease protein n=2 Tax=Alphaproteobacteria TaxID=28211 RepID=A0A917WMK0_9RHOB|nr:TRAP transporter small permease [Pseudooceanicola nanhaiensis]GGM16632.1 hypothetical protein GCM10011534_43190 [Pseudooceanicola nanhaiensis]
MTATRNSVSGQNDNVEDKDAAQRNDRGPRDRIGATRNREYGPMKALDRILSGISTVTGVIAGICLMLMLALIMADVSAKYLFHMPITGTLEIVSYYFMPIAVYLALPYVERSGEHISVPLVTDLLPVLVRHILSILVALFSAAYLLVVAWACGEKAAALMRTGEEVGLIYFDLIIWPPRWLVPIAFVLMAIQIVHGAFKKDSEAHAQ